MPNDELLDESAKQANNPLWPPNMLRRIESLEYDRTVARWLVALAVGGSVAALIGGIASRVSVRIRDDAPAIRDQR